MIRYFFIAALGIYTILGTGCSSAGDPSTPMLSAGDSTTMAAPTSPEACTNHEEGCPCDKPGDTTDCGRIKRVAGDYVWCSTGTQTCTDDGLWGKCTGDQIANAPTTAQ